MIINENTNLVELARMMGGNWMGEQYTAEHARSFRRFLVDNGQYGKVVSAQKLRSYVNRWSTESVF